MSCAWGLRVWLLWPWHRKAQWLSQPKIAMGLTCPLLLAQFLSTLMQAKKDNSHLYAISLKSTPPLLPPLKLGPGQPCLKLLFHPLHSDHSHGRVISGVFDLQFSSSFLSTFLGFHHLTAKNDRPAQELFIYPIFTPKLRSENENWHHPIHLICSVPYSGQNKCLHRFLSE